MKNLYAFIILLFTYFPIHAQDFAPVGAEWTLGFEAPGPTQWVHAYKTVNVVDEQMKEGKLCRVLVGQTQPHSPNFIDSNFVYNDSTAVYAWFRKESMFQKVFDFSAQVNDTWDILIDEGFNAIPVIDTFRIHVDSVYTEQIGGVSTNSYTFSIEYLSHDSTLCPQYNYSLSGVRANSKLGYGYYVFPVMNNLCVTDPYTMSELHPHLRCYTDFETNYTDLNTMLGNFPSCDYSTVGVDEIDVSTLNIRVDENTILVDQDHQDLYTMTLYNIHGQQVCMSTNTQSLDVSGIQQGLYIVHLKNKGTNVSKKIKL